MSADDVLELYNGLLANNIAVWIDGGWCVDALLGRQTRQHGDLDVAVARKDVLRLRDLLTSWGYQECFRDSRTDWNFVMENPHGKSLDVHVFEFDETGKNVYGVEYPYDSLGGTGIIGVQMVNCISAEWIFKFKTAYTPKEKDLKDLELLAKAFGFELPTTHLPTQEKS